MNESILTLLLGCSHSSSRDHKSLSFLGVLRFVTAGGEAESAWEYASSKQHTHIGACAS